MKSCAYCGRSCKPTREHLFPSSLHALLPDLQFNFFERQHDWTWKLEENVLLGDNTESSDDSTIWLGDETWGDLLCEIQFNMGDVGFDFRARQKDDTTFDVLHFSIGSSGFALVL